MSFGTHVFREVGAFGVNIVPEEEKRKKKEENRVNAFGSNGGWQELSCSTTGITDGVNQ